MESPHIDLSMLGPLVATAALAATEYSPAFFWSPKASALEPKTQHHAAVSGFDVETTSALLGDASREVNLVFLAQGLSTETVRQHGGALPSVERLLQKSASALTMPFTTAHDSELFALAPHVLAAEAEDYFKARPTLFTNGAPDTVVIELPVAAGATVAEQLAAHDAAIERVSRAVDAGTGGNYAALLASTQRGAQRGGAHRRLAAQAPPAYLHTTPTLLTAQIIGLLLFVIFLGGFCCLFSLQTPKRFEDTSKAQ